MRGAWSRKTGIPEADVHGSLIVLENVFLSECVLEEDSCVCSDCMAIILTMTPILGLFPQSKTSVEFLQYILMWKSNCEETFL